ncbi:hypothetical protein CCACVL1_18407 [Corchorus capsularis]|uniref:Uncharacterized protein n=1 Tax=Corchorus capsularis TaxID=210143 RepID=A0A1R3HLJ0_COCAP|nr:hypothetical protein CCACVL1_18407 [Corchorus capsularis]
MSPDLRLTVEKLVASLKLTVTDEEERKKREAEEK